MALILAINPGNTHSPTLARLARELKGVELIGAESCAVAMRAVDERVPDLVLLPSMSPRGENDLLARLMRIPGGVPTLRLPAPMAADPQAIAAEIREILSGPAAPIIEETEPDYLVGAAHVAVGWIRARRATWSGPEAYTRPRPGEPEPEPPEPEIEVPAPWLPPPPIRALETPAAASSAASAAGHSENARAQEEFLPTADAAVADTPDLFGAPQPARSWLPVAAILLVLAAAGAAGVWYWTRSTASSQPASTPPASATPGAAASGIPDSMIPPPEITADLKFPDAPQSAPPAAAAPGSFTVSAPFDVTVTEANTAIPLDAQKRATITSGRHRLRFRNEQMGYDETRTVDVPPNGTASVALNPQTTVRVTSNQPAEVLIDGARLGQTPYEGAIGLGSRTIVVRSPAGERQYIIQATSQPVQIDVDFTRP